jgi:hypothetical protein
MNSQRFAIDLTVINLVILAAVLTRPIQAAKPDSDTASVLRVRGLELLDDQGRVRAMLKVFPATPDLKNPDGTTGYPETVLFRLINSKGAPNVKIAATEDGSAISLVGEANPTHIQVMARGATTSMTMVNADRKKRTANPE